MGWMLGILLDLPRPTKRPLTACFGEPCLYDYTRHPNAHIDYNHSLRFTGISISPFVDHHITATISSCHILHAEDLSMLHIDADGYTRTMRCDASNLSKIRVRCDGPN
jgi:hypothetical protein